MKTRHLAHAILFAGFCLTIGQGTAGPVADMPEPLTRIGDIRSLSRDEAGRQLPVKVVGVITLRTNSVFFLQDGDQSICVDLSAAVAAKFWRDGPALAKRLVPGTKITLDGVTDPGGYVPQIFPRTATILDTVKLPDPRHPPMERLMSGVEDCQWIELEGVVQDAAISGPEGRQLVLVLAVDGQTCKIIVHDNSGMSPTEFIDARVRVKGVFSAQVNLRNEISGLVLFVADKSSLNVLRPPLADPFQSQHVALNRLLPFAPAAMPGHLKVTSGVVNFVNPGKFFFLQDDTTGVRVDTNRTDLKAGDRVEVAGFVTTAYTLAALRGAQVRHVGPPVPVIPVAVDVNSILKPRLRSKWTGEAFEDYGGRLVKIHGRLLRVETGQGGEPHELTVEADGTVFTALLPVEHAPALPKSWSEGAIADISGTCELDFGNVSLTANSISVSGFRLWIAAADHVHIVHAPSWWTARRLLLALTGTAILLLLVLAWVGLLRRQVARRSSQLAKEISAGREARLEFDTILRERTRLAADLHDTLEQTLTGLSLQIQAADLFRTEAPDRSASHLRLAQQFLDRSREDVHRTVWDLRARGLDGQSLLAALDERARQMVDGSNIRIESHGSASALPDFISGNLLLLAQEAITNAIKHAQPDTITIDILTDPNGVTIKISDNGRGFTPEDAPGHKDGHFGLQGMRERIKRLGGHMTITSAPGAGTVVEAFVPSQAITEEKPLT